MTHRAKTSILAWAAVTFAHLKLAVDPSVTRPTGAGVTALTCIHTCGSVHTWLVMCAKIQICFERNSHIFQHQCESPCFSTFQSQIYLFSLKLAMS